VKGLPFGVDEATVQAIFSAYGQLVNCKVLATMPGQTDSAALIRFGTQEIATWVKENLDGNIPQGMETPVIIKYKAAPAGKGGGKAIAPQAGGWGAAVDPSAAAWGGGGGGGGAGPYGGGGGGGGGFGGGGGGAGKAIAKGFEDSGGLPCGSGVGVSDNGTLYISGLPQDTEEIDVYKIFSPFGSIKPKGVKMVTNPDGSCKGFGFVNFIDEASAQTAISTCDQAQLPDGTFLRVSIKSGGNSVSKWGGAGGAQEQGAGGAQEQWGQQAGNAAGAWGGKGW